MDLLLNPDIVNLLVKTNGGRDRGPNFVIFVVWSTLMVGLKPGRRSYLGPAENIYLVFLVLFRHITSARSQSVK